MLLFISAVFLSAVSFGAGALVGRNNKDKVEQVVAQALAERNVLQADAAKIVASVRAKL